MSRASVLGLHHVTGIAGPAQENADFYAGLLGLRVVKQTVNFDDPSTYHLYYADNEARPGSVLTFFPWADARPGQAGPGQASATAYAVPPGAIDWWVDRFDAGGVDRAQPLARFGHQTLAFYAPDGLRLELVEVEGATGGWTDGAIPLSAALAAFYSVTLCSTAPERTARLLTEVMGYREVGQEQSRLRLENPRADRAAFLELYCAPGSESPGRMGAGTVHHVAFRVPDDEAQRAVRAQLLAYGLEPTLPIDRQYFHSIYFREPGGILFEVATDLPGFAVDEAPGQLGRSLKLPPQYEPQRAQIEQALPPLAFPTPVQPQ